MIRDPSDGSVRGTPVNEISVIGDNPTSGAIGGPLDNPLGFDTGLPPTSRKPKNLERLEASRTWLKDYHAKKGRSI